MSMYLMAWVQPSLVAAEETFTNLLVDGKADPMDFQREVNILKGRSRLAVGRLTSSLGQTFAPHHLQCTETQGLLPANEILDHLDRNAQAAKQYTCLWCEEQDRFGPVLDLL